VVELQTAFLVALGAVALFGFYYDLSESEFLEVLAITCGLTESRSPSCSPGS
jgi:hypothetical protein